jgi:hypothetical protein
MKPATAGKRVAAAIKPATMQPPTITPIMMRIMDMTPRADFLYELLSCKGEDKKHAQQLYD